MAAAYPRRLSIAVLAGGNSAEREISLRSGAAVASALAGNGHRITELDPAAVELHRVDWRQFDAAFIALHGTFGEDGGVQEILERAGIPFTGSSAEASRLAFSKSAAKERFFQAGVPTPHYALIHQSDNAARIESLFPRIGFPMAVKPDAQGSSLGVTIVQSPLEIPQALANCFSYDPFGLLETAVPGTEWTVGFLDDMALPVIQIETEREFFDFQAKYDDDATRYLFDFNVPDDVVRGIETTARNACTALGTRGLVRVDLRLDRFLRPWVLEVNTVPGLTDHSLVPKAAARMGIAFEELCERAVRNWLIPILSVGRTEQTHTIRRRSAS